jgi:DNA-binding XRE family transcriptional regulator
MTSAAYKRLRESLGTQTEVAKRLGVRQETISRRENGKLPINAEAADAMSHQKCEKEPVIKTLHYDLKKRTYREERLSKPKRK